MSNKDVLDKFGTALAGMGISTGLLPTLAVATGVIVLHLTVKTFCEEYSTEGE